MKYQYSSCKYVQVFSFSFALGVFMWENKHKALIYAIILRLLRERERERKVITLDNSTEI